MSAPVVVVALYARPTPSTSTEEGGDTPADTRGESDGD